MHLQNVFVCLHFIYNSSTRFLCVYILIACSSKNPCGIAQLDVGYVIVCSAERMKVFSGVSWLSVVWSGKLKYGIRALVFNTEPGWADES
jgi:hypothetical protein